MAPTMTSAISMFLESLAPVSAGVGLLESGSSAAEPKPAPTPLTPADSEMGATAAGRSASNATSAKRSNPAPPLAPPPATRPAHITCSPHPPPRTTFARDIRTFRAVAHRDTLASVPAQRPTLWTRQVMLVHATAILAGDGSDGGYVKVNIATRRHGTVHTYD